MGLIAALSGSWVGSEQTGGWVLPLLGRLAPGAGPETLHGLHAALRKLGHLTEYGVLAALWWRALRPAPPRGGAAPWALALAVAYAALDEARQGLAGNRTASVADVLLDALGALGAVAALEGPGRLARRVLGAGRVAAAALAAGSLGAAALDWWLGAAAWDLLAAALGGAAAALGLGWLLRQPACGGAPAASGTPRPGPPGV